MKNNILCYIDGLNSGGAERQLTYLAKLLKSKDYNVMVYCYHPVYFYEYALQQEGIKLIKKTLKRNNYWNIFKNTWKVITENKVDTIIAYSQGAVIMASLMKLVKPKLNVIVSERNTTQKMTRLERIKFFVYRFADSIVVNSHTQTKFIRQNYPRLAKKTYTITNYIDTVKFSPADNKGRSGEKLKIIVAARHSLQKNVPRFIDAVKMAKERNLNFRVVWYGEDGGGDKQQHIDYAKQLGLDDCLTFHNSKEDIENAYREADVFCLPSLYEGYPNVVCEAMCCGMPVICSNVSDTPYLIEDGVNGFLFNPTKTEDIADAIQKVCEITYENRLEIGKRNRQKAEGLFSAESFVNEYIKLIDK